MKKMKEPFDRYGITDNGDIYSLIKREPYLMKPYFDKDGYLRVSLSLRDGTKKKVIVSRMVYSTYGKNSVDNLVVRHIDGDKLNNHISNLKIGTVLDNNRDKQRHGTQCRGSNHGIAKLKECDIPDIRNRDIPIKKLMKKYGISKSLVDKIRAREIWKHI